MTSVAFPFLRLDDTAVVASSWLVSVEGRAHEALSGQLEHWDYSAKIDLGRTIEVDFELAARQLEIDKRELQMLVVVSVGTGGSRLPRSRQIVWRRLFCLGDSKAKVQIEIDSSRLAHNLILATDIILANSFRSSSSLAPRHSATRLWLDETVSNLEPSHSRFPIEVVSFRRILRDQAPDALWFLDWSAVELGREFASAVRLYVNADVPEFIDRVREPDSITLRLLISSIIAQMARAAVQEDSFSLGMAHEDPGTVGAVIAYWLGSAFPNQSLDTLKSRAELDPAAFEASLGSIASSSRG